VQCNAAAVSVGVIDVHDAGRVDDWRLVVRLRLDNHVVFELYDVVHGIPWPQADIK